MEGAAILEKYFWVTFSNFSISTLVKFEAKYRKVASINARY